MKENTDTPEPLLDPLSSWDKGESIYATPENRLANKAKARVNQSIFSERYAQSVKWGTEVKMLEEYDGDLREYLIKKLVILMEEVGELSKAVLDWKDLQNVYEEAIQTAAVATALAEGIMINDLEQGASVA